MDTFVKLFFEKEIIDSSLKVVESFNEDSEIDFIKLIKKAIFKPDVLADFKQIHQSILSSDKVSISNEVTRKTIHNLISLRSSKNDDDFKVKAFHYIFRAFALNNKDNEEEIIQFFIVLAIILGFDILKGKELKDTPLFFHKDSLENTLGEKIAGPTSVSFNIINELLIDLSQVSINLNSQDNQKYLKWFSELIKFVAGSQPLDIFMEIFSTCCELDVKIFEANLQSIFVSIFSQTKFMDAHFCYSYKVFLVKTFQICAKFQRSHKFISKFFLSLKSSNNCDIVQDKILPQEFLVEFSNIIKGMTNKQSISIFEILLQHLDESFDLLSQKCSGVDEVFLRSVVTVTKSFFEEVKIFSPSLSPASAQSFIEKIITLKSVLQKFGQFLSEDISFVSNNTIAFLSYLELCFYCTEIEIFMNCYKDFFSKDCSDSSVELQTSCIDTKLWNNLIKNILNLKLTLCFSVCLQIALQKLRILKLNQKDILNEKSVQKIIVSSILWDETNRTALDFVSPEDMTFVMEVLTRKHQKIVVGRVLKEILKNPGTGLTWLSDSKLQENITFVVVIFSILMKETNGILTTCLEEKLISKFNWLTQEYFDENNAIETKLVENLPEVIDTLLKKVKAKKIKSETLESKEWFLEIVKVLKKLPLINLDPKCRQLGLSFAVAIATVSSTHKNTIHLLLEYILNFLSSNVDASVCFNVGLCIKWLSDLFFENEDTDYLRVKIIESLVRSCPNSKFGLNQIGEIIEIAETFQHDSQLRALETQVTMYSELGKCWLRAKKRKSENDLIGNYRSKLARVILEKAEELEKNGLKEDNYKVLFKVVAVNLSKSLKSNNEAEILEFIQNKYSSFFNYAINNVETTCDESSVLLLSTILQGMPAMRKLIPEDSLYRLWVALKRHEKINWRLFLINSTKEEFELILSDLSDLTKAFLNSNNECNSANCFEIWVSFFEVYIDIKTPCCQIALHKLFDYIIESDFLITDLEFKKKYFLTKFLAFCVANKKVILTSQMTDTVLHLINESSNEKDLSIKDFHDLFIVRVEACSAILSRQFAWNKNKVHLIYGLFQHMLSSLTNRCTSNVHINNDDIFLLSTCAFSLEKWVSLMTGKQKDFARIGAYFISTIISLLASITLLPAVKIHLINCLNHFLSMSDTHTNSYILRVLKPGYQQVFNSVYEQFKKYYKFSGKV